MFGILHVFSQTIIGIVEDENNNSLSGVTVINQKNKNGVITDINGQFKIKAKVKDVLKFSYIGKETKYLVVKKKDTVFILVKLKDKLTHLKEFVVNTKRIKKVSVKDNDNVLDYYSLGENTFLVLKSSHKKYFLAIEGIDTIYKTYPINELKPKSLFLDVFGNFHLICKDSVRQFHFDSTLCFVNVVSTSTFLNLIKPLIFVTDANTFSYKYSNHNKKYSILINFKKALYEIFDEESANYAFHFLTQNFGRDEAVRAKNGSDLKSSRDAFVAKVFYKKMLARELKVYTFFYNNNILVYNLEFKTLNILNLKGDEVSNHSLGIDYNKVILDKRQNKFYAYSINSGIVALNKLNLKTGKTTDSYELKGVTFPKNLKIINGWAYFIKINRAEFHKLYRMSL